jgi:hypothetical protein
MIPIQNSYMLRKVFKKLTEHLDLRLSDRDGYRIVIGNINVGLKGPVASFELTWVELVVLVI